MVGASGEQTDLRRSNMAATPLDRRASHQTELYRPPDRPPRHCCPSASRCEPTNRALTLHRACEVHNPSIWPTDGLTLGQDGSNPGSWTSMRSRPLLGQSHRHLDLSQAGRRQMRGTASGICVSRCPKRLRAEPSFAFLPLEVIDMVAAPHHDRRLMHFVPYFGLRTERPPNAASVRLAARASNRELKESESSEEGIVRPLWTAVTEPFFEYFCLVF